MADIEKVIKGMESCIGHCAMKDCPYFTESCEAFAGCNGNQIMADALELLKEQRKVIECLKEKVKKYELEKSWDENPDRMNGCCW